MDEYIDYNVGTAAKKIKLLFRLQLTEHINSFLASPGDLYSHYMFNIYVFAILFACVMCNVYAHLENLFNKVFKDQ